jgi:hypothetical protein
MDTAAETDIAAPAHRGSPLDVLRVFLKLGLTCFGGPVAHIGYFRDEFVVRRKWIDEHAYADLVGLCQVLPGPASSKVGFSIGLMRAGYGGALAAWAGFTLPSSILLVLFGYGAGALKGPVGQTEADGGRDRGPGGLGHGPHALPGSGARIHRGRGGAAHSSDRNFRGADRRHRPRRPCRPVAEIYGGSPAEYGAGLDMAIAKGWL